MNKGKAFLVNVSIRDLPFPIKVHSSRVAGEQSTIANISIQARLMKEFEAECIDRFIQITHSHRDNLCVESMKNNAKDYLTALNANTVRISMDFPYFVEKRTPKSNEPCLVKYDCRYSSQYPSIGGEVRTTFSIACPVITSYPIQDLGKSTTEYFPQMSVLHIEVQPKKDIAPEQIVALADEKSLSPVYSFLAKEDQLYLIEKTRNTFQSSIDTIDGIRMVLARDENIEWYSISASNYGMLHNYSTFINLEKSNWVPGSNYEDDSI